MFEEAFNKPQFIYLFILVHAIRQIGAKERIKIKIKIKREKKTTTTPFPNLLVIGKGFFILIYPMCS